MSTYNYFYFLTTPNNKLHSFIEVLYQNINEKFIILVKNNEQMNQIHSFLKTRSIYSQIYASENIALDSIFSATNICIMLDEVIKKIEKMVTSCTIISLYGSTTQEQVIEKYSIVVDLKDSKLIELISKNDFDFVQLLYKNQEFIVKKYTAKDAQKKDSMKLFISNFAKKYIENKFILKLDGEIQEENNIFLNQVLSTMSEEDQTSYLRDFYIWANMYSVVPTLNVTDGNKKYKKIYLEIHHGILDNINKKQIATYFQACPDVEALDIKKLDQAKTIICAKGYNLKVNVLTQYVDTTAYEGQILGYTVVTEEMVNQECNKDKLQGTGQQAPRKKYFNNDRSERSYNPRQGGYPSGRSHGGGHSRGGYSDYRSDRSDRGDRDEGRRLYRKHNNEEGLNDYSNRYSQFNNSSSQEGNSSSKYYQKNYNDKPQFNKYQWKNRDNSKYAYQNKRAYGKDSYHKDKEYDFDSDK